MLYISLPMFGNVHKNKHNKPVLAKEMENGDVFSERKQMALQMQCKIIINKSNFSGKKKSFSFKKFQLFDFNYNKISKTGNLSC